MQFGIESGESLVCAVLAAQVAELRDRIDTGATVELLWRTSDVLSQLSGLVLELAKRCHDSDHVLAGQCNAALAAETEVSRSLESLAFEQAQRNDFTCQTVDCVVTALGRLATAGAPMGDRLSPTELAALYVSEDQRRVHDAVARHFAVSASLAEPGAEVRGREVPCE